MTGIVERLDPDMVRVCPERDARCPHGMNCPYSNGWRCDMVGSRAEIEANRRALRKDEGDHG